VERQKEGYQKSKNTCQDICRDDKVRDYIIKRLRICHSSTNHRIRRSYYEDASDCTVKYHTEKVLVVQESNAVGDPRTVVIHFEDATVALRTVMTPIRLRFETPLTYPNAAKFLLLYRDTNLTNCFTTTITPLGAAFIFLLCAYDWSNTSN
jgi:hypothetical protein